VVSAALLAFVGVPTAHADVFGSLTSSDATSAQAPTGRYLVKFVAGTSDADQAAVLAAAGATEDSQVAALRLHTVTLPDGSVDQLVADPSVARVEAEETRAATAVPNDPDYGSQWALPKIGWDQAFGVIAPSGSATVALLDTGVDASHPDLGGNVVPGTSILDPGANGTADANGHGTAMAGIVAASTDNGAGIAGVGYAGVDVMPVTVLDGSGVGQDGDIISGVVWAADHGADVILMPFSSPDFSPSLQEAIDYAWSRGAVLVASAGNDGSSAPHFPSGDRGVVGVANTDESDALNLSSNYGEAAFMAAPGTGIRTTSDGGGYTTITGTSASAAAVAGAAALIKAASPDASNGVIVGRLARNADATPNGDTGNGRLNLARAIGDSGSDAVQPAGAAPVGAGGPFVGPYVAASVGVTAELAPAWAGATGNNVVKFATLIANNSTGGPPNTLSNVRVTLPANYTNIAVADSKFSSGSWAAQPIAGQVVEFRLTSGSPLGANGWARIDITAKTPSTLGAADWTFRGSSNADGSGGGNTAGTALETVLIGNSPDNGSTSTSFVDGSGNPTAPVLQNGVAETLRMKIKQDTGGSNAMKYFSFALPTCFSSPSSVSAVVTNPSGTQIGLNGYSINVIDNFIEVPGGSVVNNNGFVTVTFTTTPNCSSDTVDFPITVSSNQTNSPQTANQVLRTTPNTLPVSIGGTIELKKVWQGGVGNATLKIGSTAGGSEVASQSLVGTGGTTGQKRVKSGTYFVNESFDAPTNASDYEATLACFNDADDDGTLDGGEPSITVGTSNGVPVARDNHVICTFTNGRRPEVKVVKSLVPATDGGRFDLKINSTTFDNSGAGFGDGGTTGFQQVATGSVTVAELAHAGTSLADYVSKVECDSAKGSSDPGTSHTFSVAYGDKVTCTITNQRKAQITGIKFEDQNSDGSKAGDSGLAQWEIRAYKDANSDSKADAGEFAASSTTVAGGGYKFSLTPGSYVICEVGKPNWVQTAPSPATNTCGNVSSAPGGYVLTVAFGDVEADKDFGNAKFGSTSTMTNSAFQLVDDLTPWTISDFEILVNAQNTIVATNPGQFYYHQRGTNSSTGPATMKFDIRWPCDFVPQTSGGQPIHAYVQYESDPANTWRDWLPQSTNVNANSSTCKGTIDMNDVPKGAKVWVTVHLDYRLKGTQAPADFLKKPITYGPFTSTIVAPGGTSVSSTSLIGRGKKVTAVYGTLTNKATGDTLGNAWVRISQGTSSATALVGSDGFYLAYDGQACASTDGLAGGCYNGANPLSTWNFANGSNVNTTVRILGTEANPTTPTVPPAGAAAAYPQGMAFAEVKASSWIAKNPPTYDFGVAKGTGYSRDWRFTP
jgi:subtilisin family serine protease